MYAAEQKRRPLVLELIYRMKRLIAPAMIMAFLCVPSAEANERRVPFSSGVTAATLKGNIRGRGEQNYVLKAKAGQVLQVLFTPSNGACAINVFQPGQASAAHIGSVAGNEFGRSPTLAGDYRIQVYLARSAARRNESCDYVLSVELTGIGAASIPTTADKQLVEVCRTEASKLYGVSKRRIATNPIARAASAVHIDGVANKGQEGRKKLRCIFNPDRSFSHIMALTSDGE